MPLGRGCTSDLSRRFTGGKTHNLRRHGMADLLGHLVEGWVTALGRSVMGSFQTRCHPPFPQCEAVLSSLGA